MTIWTKIISNVNRCAGGNSILTDSGVIAWLVYFETTIGIQ